MGRGQQTLLGAFHEAPSCRSSLPDLLQGSIADVAHRPLDDRSWVDYVPGWVPSADELLAKLLKVVPWEAERRAMYDRMVDVPRLQKFYGDDEPLPLPGLNTMRDILSAHYQPVLGEPFATAGMCLYRDEKDSVAWHGDDLGRSKTEDTVVAIVSLGATRPFLLRPRGGGKSTKLMLHHGDLVAMGGACQREWEHAIPKTAAPHGPRVSIQFRTHNVR